MRISALPEARVSACFSKKGKAVKKIKEKDFVPVLLEEINLMLDEKKKV